MQGYDTEKARLFIQQKINRKGLDAIAPMLGAYIQEAQALDLQFMHETGALDAEGFASDGEYDEDDALEYIAEGLIARHGLNDEEAVVVASFVDAYMAAQEAFLLREGLLDLS